MEESKEELMTIFDFLWFESSVLNPCSSSSTTNNNPCPVPSSRPPSSANSFSLPPEVSAAPNQEKETPRPLLGLPSSLRRSASADTAFATHSALLSRRRGSEQRKLNTILSGKEDEAARGVGSSSVDHEEEEGKQRKPPAHNRRKQQQQGEKKRGKSMSMSDLEFEELKGFMDLGFNFSEAETADPHLVSIVPGLGRLQGKEKDLPVAAAPVEEEEPKFPRPYLSEAWEAAETRRRKAKETARKREEERLLRNWKLPAAGEGVDLREHLRHWAHTVASTVR